MQFGGYAAGHASPAAQQSRDKLARVPAGKVWDSLPGQARLAQISIRHNVMWQHGVSCAACLWKLR